MGDRFVPSFSFDDTLSVFNLPNAIHCAEAADLVYDAQDSILSVLTRWKFEDRVFIDVDGTQVFVARRDKVAFVAFRGTEANATDFMTDLRFIKKPGALGQTHHGFERALDRVWDTTLNLVKGHVNEGRQIWVTGHSLGGALAELAAGRMHLAGVPAAGVYTFGKPRVGDEEYVAAFDNRYTKNIYNVVNDKDIVPHLPPRKMGFSHPGVPVVVDGKPNVNARSLFEKLFEIVKDKVEDAAAALQAVKHFKSEHLEDHKIRSYIGALNGE